MSASASSASSSPPAPLFILSEVTGQPVKITATKEGTLKVEMKGAEAKFYKVTYGTDIKDRTTLTKIADLVTPIFEEMTQLKLDARTIVLL